MASFRIAVLSDLHLDTVVAPASWDLARDALKARQRIIPAIPLTVQQATLVPWYQYQVTSQPLTSLAMVIHYLMLLPRSQARGPCLWATAPRVSL